MRKLTTKVTSNQLWSLTRRECQWFLKLHHTESHIAKAVFRKYWRWQLTICQMKNEQRLNWLSNEEVTGTLSRRVRCCARRSGVRLTVTNTCAWRMNRWQVRRWWLRTGKCKYHNTPAQIGSELLLFINWSWAHAMLVLEELMDCRNLWQCNNKWHVPQKLIVRCPVSWTRRQATKCWPRREKYHKEKTCVD